MISSAIEASAALSRVYSHRQAEARDESAQRAQEAGQNADALTSFRRAVELVAGDEETTPMDEDFLLALDMAEELEVPGTARLRRGSARGGT